MAQTIPSVGTSGTFDIATWNIEWFGASNGPANDALQFQNVLEVVRQSGIDFWAVQEIADASDFSRLLDSLGTDYDGSLATTSGQQRVGFIYKTEAVNVRSVKHVLTSFDADFATRPPLQLEADITIADSTRRVTFLTIHMKCCGSASDHGKRLAASGRLKNHIDFTGLTDEPVIVLGDFNDELENSISSGRDTPYRNFLDDTANYAFLTLPMDQAGLNTYCSSSLCTNGSTLDHILVTNELFADVESGTTDHFVELTSAIAGYTNNTSDHLPVFARLRYGISTSTGGREIHDSSGEFLAVYPNPASSHAIVDCMRGERPSSDCRVEVYDVRGRLVATASESNAAYVEIDTRLLPTGTYFARFVYAAGTAPSRFVVAR